MLVDTPRGLQPLHPGSKVPTEARASGSALNDPQAAGAAPSVSAEAAAAATALDLRKTIYQSTYKGARPVDESEAQSLAKQADAAAQATTGAPTTYSCNTCGTDCTRQRYQAINVKNFTLCPNCYLEGRFPSSMFSGDFLRMDNTEFKHGGADAVDTEGWTDEETLRLLEGLEMFDDDWSAVSNHVGTRSREQCIMKFIQMPIEDPYLDGGASAASASSGKANGGAGQGIAMRDLGPLQYIRDSKLGVPFSQVDNPVMSVVAFLASTVSPAVAAAAAQSALGELTDGLRRKQKEQSTESQQGKEGEKESEKEKEGDTVNSEAMDVDKTSEEKEQAAEAANAPPRSPAGVNGEPVTPRLSASADVTISISAAAKSAMAQAKEDREDGGEGTEKERRDVPADAVPKNAVERVAAIALGAAAAKAHILSSFEERECQRLVGQVVDAQMRKLEVRMTFVFLRDQDD